MRHTRTSVNGLICSGLMALACGCHGAGKPPVNRPPQCVCSPGGPCGGYSSTCWRQWPDECTMCPPQVELSEAMPSAPETNEPIPAPAPRPPELPLDLPPAQPDEAPSPQSGVRPDAEAPAADDQGAQRPRRRSASNSRRRSTPNAPLPDQSIVIRRPAIDPRQPAAGLPRQPAAGIDPGAVQFSYPAK